MNLQTRQGRTLQRQVTFPHISSIYSAAALLVRGEYKMPLAEPSLAAACHAKVTNEELFGYWIQPLAVTLESLQAHPCVNHLLHLTHRQI